MKEKWRKYQDIVYILLMLLYPLTRVNQGVSVIDTTYSLSNFAFFDSMKGTWMVATYLANVVGYGIMHLPFGRTLLGFNVYTSFLISTMAIGTYQVLKKEFPRWLVFVTQMIAIGLCWAPTTILYHYLTYFFLQFGVLFLFCGITGEKEKQNRNFFLAGVFLGLNLTVRMPNVTHMLLIVAVWYGCFLYEKPAFSVYLKKTGVCILGYLTGAGIPFAGICIQYGPAAYPDMVYTMFAMTEKATDYTPLSMLTSMFGAYGKAFVWLSPWLFIWLLGSLCSERELFSPAFWKSKIPTLVYLLSFAVLLRYYWGKGLFDFRYYHYGAVYYLVVMFLLTAALVSLVTVLAKKEKERKVAALLTLLLLFLVPLGGNNELYPLMNDLFFILPVTFGVLYRIWQERKQNAYLVLPAVLMGLVLLVQSVGFHQGFALQDGDFGEPRNTKLQGEAISVAAGMYTTAQNACMLEDLGTFVKEEKLQGRETLFYGQVPGLGYLLNMPSALSTFWPDLDSYRMVEFEEDMKSMKAAAAKGEKTSPVCIVSSQVAAWLEDDGEAVEKLQVPVERYTEDLKLKAIASYLEEAHYTQTFCNQAYAVYQVVGLK